MCCADSGPSRSSRPRATHTESGACAYSNSSGPAALDLGTRTSATAWATAIALHGPRPAPAARTARGCRQPRRRPCPRESGGGVLFRRSSLTHRRTPTSMTTSRVVGPARGIRRHSRSSATWIAGTHRSTTWPDPTQRPTASGSAFEMISRRTTPKVTEVYSPRAPLHSGNTRVSAP